MDNLSLILIDHPFYKTKIQIFIYLSISDQTNFHGHILRTLKDQIIPINTR